jgi:hypothetical protein
VPRSIRIEYPGAFYHVMARGNRREAIFRNDSDRQLFLKTLGEAKCETSGSPALPPEMAFICQELMPDPYFPPLQQPSA